MDWILNIIISLIILYLIGNFFSCCDIERFIEYKKTLEKQNDSEKWKKILSEAIRLYNENRWSDTILKELILACYNTDRINACLSYCDEALIRFKKHNEFIHYMKAQVFNKISMLDNALNELELVLTLTSNKSQKEMYNSIIQEVQTKKDSLKPEVFLEKHPELLNLVPYWTLKYYQEKGLIDNLIKEFENNDVLSKYIYLQELYLNALIETKSYKKLAKYYVDNEEYSNEIRAKCFSIKAYQIAQKAKDLSFGKIKIDKYYEGFEYIRKALNFYPKDEKVKELEKELCTNFNSQVIEPIKEFFANDANWYETNLKTRTFNGIRSLIENEPDNLNYILLDIQKEYIEELTGPVGNGTYGNYTFDIFNDFIDNLVDKTNKTICDYLSKELRADFVIIDIFDEQISCIELINDIKKYSKENNIDKLAELLEELLQYSNSYSSNIYEEVVNKIITNEQVKLLSDNYNEFDNIQEEYLHGEISTINEGINSLQQQEDVKNELKISSCSYEEIISLPSFDTEKAERFIKERNNGKMWYDLDSFAQDFHIQPHEMVELQDILIFPIKPKNIKGRKVEW